MGKRKVYVKSDISTIKVEHHHDDSGKVIILPEVIPPAQTFVIFPSNIRNRANFDFAPWYGLNIDELTYACQRQIERFLDKQDSEVATLTVLGYCSDGLKYFLDYAAMLAQALARPILLGDINRSMIDGFLRFLRDRASTCVTSQRTQYNYVKAVLVALGRRGLIDIVEYTDDATFPHSPFPDAHRHEGGEKPFSLKERKAFTAAVKTAALHLFQSDATAPSIKMLTNAFLVVALHTGRNTVPLLEMTTDALRPHPKDAMEFLVLYKRRGHSTSKVVVRSAFTAEQLTIESMPSVRLPVARLIRKVIDLTADVRADAPPELRNRVWLWRSENGEVKALSMHHLSSWIRKLVLEYNLKDSDGKPLRVNVSRLRKTFINRINEILDGDLAATAAAAGNKAVTADRHYLRAGEDATRNWRFMGICLVEELLTATLGATERTPVGRCTDPQKGEFAPKREGAICQSFLNCLRCRNYVVTGNDLWRLFSFYWRILRERNRMGKRRWEQRFAHIPRLIDRDVIDAGLAKKVFDKKQVDDARKRARYDPHPFWATDSIINILEILQ